jgi:hypothetical protein
MLPHAMECCILHDRLRIVTSKGGQSFLASRQCVNIINFFPQQNRKKVDCITSFLNSAGVWLYYCHSTVAAYIYYCIVRIVYGASLTV